jgi:hypothetical protein
MLDEQLNAEKFEALLDKLRSSNGGLAAFQTDPLSMLRNERIDLISETDLLGKDRNVLQDNAPPHGSSSRGIRPHGETKESERIWADMNWWGIRIYLNDPVCKDIGIGSLTGSGLTGLCGGALVGAGIVTAGAAAVVGAVVGAIIILKNAEIALANNGKGVFFPISWLQWAPILALFPGSPPSLAAAAILIHPLRIT